MKKSTKEVESSPLDMFSACLLPLFVFSVFALMLMIENIATRSGGGNIYFTVFVSMSCASLVLQFSNPIMHSKSIVSVLAAFLCVWIIARIRIRYLA